MIQLPINNQPNQSFKCTIPIVDTNITLSFYVYWNRIAEYWQMNITNVITGEMLIEGLALVTGQNPVQNLLRQWAYFNISNLYLFPIVSSGAPDWPAVGDWISDFAATWGNP